MNAVKTPPKQPGKSVMTNGKSYKLKAHPRYGFLQVRPTPTLKEITDFYAKEFYSAHYQRCNDSSLDIQIRDKDFYDGHWTDLCDNIEDLRGRSLKGAKVLDIGCGWGQALLQFRERGMICFGFDPVADAVKYAHKQKLNVVEAGMDRVDVFPKETFDVVTVLNVLEHLADPVQILKNIRTKILKPGGLLVIDVPNEFNAFQLCGQKIHGLPPWWIAPPAHLNYFDGKSLKKLLTGLGYQVERLESSFPMEMFLLFGHNYVQDGALGRQCHEQRMAFELNLRKQGQTSVLRRFYQSLAEQNLGRQIVAYAMNKSL